MTGVYLFISCISRHDIWTILCCNFLPWIHCIALLVYSQFAYFIIVKPFGPKLNLTLNPTTCPPTFIFSRTARGRTWVFTWTWTGQRKIMHFTLCQNYCQAWAPNPLGADTLHALQWATTRTMTRLNNLIINGCMVLVCLCVSTNHSNSVCDTC